MSASHGKSKKTKTGAKRLVKRNKIKAELGREPPKVTIGAEQRVYVKGRGNTSKHELRSSDVINVLDQATKVTKKTKILTAVKNEANRHYVRMNILTKGAIIKTEIGNVRITNRPAQDGFINGILVGKD